MLEFQTVKRKSKIGEVTWAQWTIMISIILVFQFIAFSAYSEKNFKAETDFTNTVGNISCILCIIGMGGFIIGFLSNTFPITYENLNGDIIGKLILKEDGIILNNLFYKFEEIQKLEINANHFKGEHEIIIASGGRFTPYYKIGKGNFINILTKNGKNINQEFIINSKSDIVHISNYLSDVAHL